MLLLIGEVNHPGTQGKKQKKRTTKEKEKKEGEGWKKRNVNTHRILKLKERGTSTGKCTVIALVWSTKRVVQKGNKLTH